MNKTCIIISGPTASGKSSIALELARHFNTSIISADSRQCYREMNIGVAKPPEEELAEIPHHFINTHHIQEEVNAAIFEEYAISKVNEVFTQNDFAVTAGGTGLYIKAFAEGLDQIPETDPKHRNFVEEGYLQGGITWLQQELFKMDTLYAAEGEMQNPRRMMRALEVVLSTGNSIKAFQKKASFSRDFKIMHYALDWPREMLYQRINRRVDDMMAMGLVDEARGLYPHKGLKALQTVGYKELFRYFDDELKLPEATALIKQNTRHYAKRQMTWFKKEDSIIWCNATEPDAVVSKIVQDMHLK